MRKFIYFLYHTFIGQEKNRRDVLDYLWAISIITMFILLVREVMHR